MVNDWKYSSYSNINSKIRKNFPFETPRQHQLETISEIKEAIDKGYKYIVLEAGTGTGKSAIAATLALMFDSNYILTVTKQLQDQYIQDFKSLGFKLVKGRSNFKCRKYAEDNIDKACDEGRCVLEGYKCEYSLNRNYDDVCQENTCHYYYQKFVAMNSRVVISNYPYLFLELNYVGDFKKRNLMVFDEAHNLEDILMGQLKLEFKRKELKENVGINLSSDLVSKLELGDYTDWIRFIKRVKNSYSREFDKIKNIKGKPGLNEKKSFLRLKISDCNRFINHISRDPQNWIFDFDRRYGVAEFKPIKVDKYGKANLFKYADVCLFMSATILDYKLFAKWLGIDENEIYAIRRESPFDIHRNPIKTYDDFKLSYNNLSEVAPKTIDAINEILEIHKNDKGIIHTISYQCKSFLMKSLKTNRLIDHNTYNRSKQLEKYKNSDEALVLISPSMNEGVDLPGDQCRFQIIYKMPFPSLADKQTNERKYVDAQWYDYKAALALVQTYGRGMRYEQDYCRTYFIDNRLMEFVSLDKITNNFLPKFFTHAINIAPAEITNDEKSYFKPVKLKENLINSQNSKHTSDKKTFKNKNDEKDEKYSSEYFNLLAKKVTEEKEYKSYEDLTKHRSDDYIRFDNEGAVNQKAELKNQGKLLEKEDFEKAVKFYDDIKHNDLFKHDYYPYRRQNIIFKNKLHDDERDWQTILELLSKEIYLDKYQYTWINNKIIELIGKLNIQQSGLIKINSLLQKYEINKDKYHNLQDDPVPICERIFKDDDGGLKVISQEKYDFISNINYIVELGVGYIRREEYEQAMMFYSKLLNQKNLYFRYIAYKNFARIYRDMNNKKEFSKLYKKYVEVKS